MSSLNEIEPQKRKEVQQSSNQTIMTQDNIIQQLNGFDFSSLLTVNVIFEDDEEQSFPTEYVENEKTKNKENVTKSSVENITQIIKTRQESNDTSNVDMTVESQSTLSSSQTNSNENEVTTIDGKKEDLSTLNTDCNNKSLKRKFQDESQTELKIRKTDESKQNTLIHQNSLVVQNELPNATKEDVVDANNSNIEITCITNLLKNVSNHLILILEAYNKYVKVKRNTNLSPSEKEKHQINFLRVKQHFFNLSFCIVDNIILPQQNNIIFTGQFLNETLKLAVSKNMSLCLETQIAPVFFELLQWCKEKKDQLNIMATGSGSIQDNPLLRQHLQMAPQTSQSLQNNTLTGTASSNDLYSRVPDSLNRSVNTNNNYRFAPTNNYNVVNSGANSTKAMPPKINRQTTTTANTSTPPKNNIENQNSVLFSSGPPERRISITMEHSLTGTNGNQDTTNLTVTNPISGLRNENGMTMGRTAPPSYEQTYQNRQNSFQANQFNMQQSQQATQQDIPINICYADNMVQRGYETANALPPSWIQNGHRPMEMQRPVVQAPPPHVVHQQMQNDQHNLENTRSTSTDSGFISPLPVHFNNSFETSKDGVQGVQDNQLMSPMITHITSLHPKAAFIEEGFCYVCGKLTRQMCVGCYKQYYCGYPCQRYDWNSHKTICKSQN